MTSAEQIFGKPWTAEEVNLVVARLPKGLKPEALPVDPRRSSRTWHIKKLRAISNEMLERVGIKPR